MGIQNVRRGVTRAGWNKQHADWYSLHYTLLCIVLGLISASWWAFLAALVLVAAIELTNLGGKVMLWIYCLPWILIFGAIGMALGGIPAACVFAIMAGGIVYIMLESGREYFHDL
jgi:hypothetical protein